MNEKITTKMVNTLDDVCRAIETGYAARGAQHYDPRARFKNTAVCVIIERNDKAEANGCSR